LYLSFLGHLIVSLTTKTVIVKLSLSFLDQESADKESSASVRQISPYPCPYPCLQKLCVNHDINRECGWASGAELRAAGPGCEPGRVHDQQGSPCSRIGVDHGR